MENKFKEDENGVCGVEGEKSICWADFQFSHLRNTRVLITDEGEYFNVYVIDPRYKQEPLNCLKLQEPKEDLKRFNKEFNPQDVGGYFNEMRLEMWAIEHYLWDKYGNPDKDTVISFSVEAHKD